MTPETNSIDIYLQKCKEIEKIINENSRTISTLLTETIYEWRNSFTGFIKVYSEEYVFAFFHEDVHDILTIISKDSLDDDIIPAFVVGSKKNTDETWKLNLDKIFGVNTYDSSNMIKYWNIENN